MANRKQVVTNRKQIDHKINAERGSSDYVKLRQIQEKKALAWVKEVGAVRILLRRGFSSEARMLCEIWIKKNLEAECFDVSSCKEMIELMLQKASRT